MLLLSSHTLELPEVDGSDRQLNTRIQLKVLERAESTISTEGDSSGSGTETPQTQLHQHGRKAEAKARCGQTNKLIQHSRGNFSVYQL